MQYNLKGNELLIEIEKSIYSIKVLHKCFYWYGDKYQIDISESGNNYEVRFTFSNNEINIDNVSELISKVKRDLIDFKLRDIVSDETKTIRELLIAKAFAYYDLDDNPTTDVNDPLGFNPDNV